MVHILIPVDGSEAAENTLTWAASLFDKHTTRYTLLYVVKLIPEIVTEPYETQAAIDTLTRCKQLLSDLGVTVEKTEHLLGEPADVICTYAKEHSIDQVIMGSHGRTGLTKLLLGSVSSAVLEHCKKPVLVYRNTAKLPAKV